MNYLNIFKASTGILGMQILSDISADDLNNVLKIAGQIIILIVTLWGMLKKKKPSA